MTRFTWYVGNFLAGCMDFGIGAVIVAATAVWLHEPLVWWYLPLGSFLAVLPDMDIVGPILLGTGQKTDHHQTPLHRPILLLPFATALAWLLGGGFWAFTTFACVLWHFVHDTKGFGGGGIAWFWPLSNKYWSFAGAANSRPTPNHRQWIEKYWLRPSTLSVRELSIAAVAFLTAIGIILIF